MNDSSSRRISNPYVAMEGYHCFGCAPHNQHGLRMEFYEDGDFVCSQWEPLPHFGGYKNVLHGGIQATLLDELAAWTVQVKLRTAGVTANIDLKFKKPVFTNKGNLLLKARIEKTYKRFAFVKTELYDHKMEICCEGVVKYFIYSKETAREKLNYPGFAEFFKEE